MSDKEIMKALECCADGDCNSCPYQKIECIDENDNNLMLKDVLGLVNRQKGKIEDLTKEKDVLTNIYKSIGEALPEVAKAEQKGAIMNIREKCIEKQEFLVGYDNKYKGYVSVEDLDYIIGELK